MIGAVVALALAGAWQASDELSPLDGRRTVTQTLVGMTSQNTPAMLMLKCQAGAITTYVSWSGAYFGNHLNEVSWRVNDTPIRREFWEAPFKLPTVTAQDNPRRLLDAMAQGGNLVMRVSSYNATQEIVFGLADSAAAVSTVREACAKR